MHCLLHTLYTCMRCTLKHSLWSAQLRVRVMPAMACQAVTPTLEAHCAAAGSKGRDEDALCKGGVLKSVDAAWGGQQ